MQEHHFLGVARRDDRPLWLDQQARFQHSYVLGQTGTGKSSWARQSFMQDVIAGRGGCYFDFHGEDARWLLNHIPPERAGDVIYINPLNPTHAVGYNPLDGIAPRHFASFTDEIVASLRHIHERSWGARMDDILMNAIRPLFDLPGESKGTLLGAVRMLNDDSYRRFVVNQTTEDTVRDFWFSEYAAWSKNDKAHNLNSSLNKIRRFQSAPILRHILGQQRSTVDFGQAIARQQLVILDLNKWKIGAVNANTLASLILSRIIYEATHRDIPVRDGKPVDALFPGFHVVIDEFQSVTSLAIVEALAGIRKSRVSFTLCHQHTDQITPEVLAAIKGKTGTKIVFRVGGDDAKRLHEMVEVTNPRELANQPDHAFIAQYKSGNSVATQRGQSVLIDYPRTHQANRILRMSQASFTRPTADIADQYTRWMQSRHYGGPVRGEVVAKPSRAKPRGQRSSAKRSGQMRSVGAIMLESGMLK
jgi:hypothetical protein